MGDTQIGITGNSSESQDPYTMIIDLKRIKTVYNIDFNLYGINVHDTIVTVANQAAQLAISLTAPDNLKKGDICIRTDLEQTYLHENFAVYKNITGLNSSMSDWERLDRTTSTGDDYPSDSKKYIKDKLLYILGNNEHPDESTGRRDIGTESTFRLIYGKYNATTALNEQVIDTVNCIKVNFSDKPEEELNEFYSGKISLLRCVDATG